ncbi:YktB family protein [Alkalicoccus luteus]|uniref:YktB family protein n=1 Tax=Alkalicoccus luteus TaxID=1237094 RepID=UPI00403464D3
MGFNGFTQDDFDVFAVDGLDERMHVLKERIRPKLEELGAEFAQELTELTGTDMYYHVAKHARRKVNPPDDTWVAFCSNKRGYKKLPHFQIGMFGSHLFIWFAVIYESPVKQELGYEWKKTSETLMESVPASFEWSVDHTKPATIAHDSLTKDDLDSMLDRLESVKKAELLCGRTIDADDPVLRNPDALKQEIKEVFQTLLPLYEDSMELYEQKV